MPTCADSPFGRAGCGWRAGRVATMSSPAYNKTKGAAFELDLVKYFRSEGLDAERLRLSGPKDEGDIALKVGGLPFVLEAKNCKRIDLGGWVAEATLEAGHYSAARALMLPPHFAVVHKRRQKPVSESFVTIPLNEWLRQIRPPF